MDIPHLNNIVRRDLRQHMQPHQIAILPLSHQVHFNVESFYRNLIQVVVESKIYTDEIFCLNTRARETSYFNTFLIFQKRLVWDSVPLASHYIVQVVYVHGSPDALSSPCSICNRIGKSLRILATLVQSFTSLTVR